MKHDWISAEWPAPANVRAIFTTRSGGFSQGPWSSLNLGTHCGDDPADVRRNRESLDEVLPVPAPWLRQVHGTTVVPHPDDPGSEPEADAVFSFSEGQVCAVLTADCLPVVFCNRAGDRVAVAHAGWRGLANGILQATIDALAERPGDLLAWLGPAIGPRSYEVGTDVAEAFPDEFSAGFVRRGDRFLMDIYAVARSKLAAAGIESVSGGNFCTFEDPERFFSYRRDGTTGRMACVAWLE